MAAPNRRALAQRILQGVLALVLVAAGIANLTGATTAQITGLGYPEYLTLILGVAYLIGVVCLYQTKYPFLQEWAFAGVAVSLVGAAASHLFAGDPLVRAAPAFVFQGVLVAAYALRAAPESTSTEAMT
ncbi:MAG: DoxX family protein [Pseudomonadota bacterium]